MEVRRRDGVQEKRMVDHLEGLADVDGDGGRPKRRLPLVEAGGDLGDQRKEGSRRRVVGPKPMLSRSKLERSFEVRKETPLEDLRCRAEERDGPI